MSAPERESAASSPGEPEETRRSGAGEAPPQSAGPVPDTVEGERGIASVNRLRSLQSRAGNVLAAGLMCALGLAALAWYYAHVFARHSQAIQIAQRAARVQASGDAPLPPLGAFSPPRVASPTAKSVPTLAEQLLGPPPPLPSASATAAWDRAEALERMSAPPPPTGTVVRVSPRVSARDRLLAGPVFAPSSGAGSESEASAPTRESVPTAYSGPPGLGYEPASNGVSAPAQGADPLASLLRTTVTPAVEPSVLPTLRFLLPKGAFIDCTLETAIDSTLPGMTTCVTATDTFSADGTIVLLERGTKLVGETEGQVRQGQARLFVLWTEARTPTGVVVPLDSPGTDALGRSGLTGKVETHFWERFGAAILVTVIDAGVQYGVQASSTSGTVIINPSASEDVMTGVLRSTVDIPPTITVHQGARIQVFVARDVDFRSVYRLRMAQLRSGASP